MENITCGIDLVRIAEVQCNIEKFGQRFLRRAFSDDEISYCESKHNSYQHYAVRLAAKEAVFKALKTGWDKGIQWKHIEVTHAALGNPCLKLHTNIRCMLNEMGLQKHELSLTHCHEYAIAMVLLYN